MAMQRLLSAGFPFSTTASSTSPLAPVLRFLSRDFLAPRHPALRLVDDPLDQLPAVQGVLPPPPQPFASVRHFQSALQVARCPSRHPEQFPVGRHAPPSAAA